MMDDRQPPQKPPLPEKPLSALSAPVPAVPSANGARAVAHVDRPPALIGVAIPSRNRTIRRRVVALYRECSWLTGADVAAAMRWAVLGEKFKRLSEVLDRLPNESGVIKASKAGDDLEPRKALGELRALSGEMTKLETSLGLTASARAALGVNVNRLQDLASAMSADDGDVAELEGRIIDRLSQGGSGPSSPSPASSSEGDDG